VVRISHSFFTGQDSHGALSQLLVIVHNFMFAMAGQSGPSQGLNPYSGLESFDRKQTPSPALSNLIDLNSASSRSSTVTSRPSVGRHAASTNSHPNS
jgi:hypothetical protein